MDGKTVTETLNGLPQLSGEEWGSMTYLALLGVVIVGYLIVANRDRLGRLLQQAAIWSFIFIGVITAVGLWGDLRDTVIPRQAVIQDTGQIEVSRHHDGHYYLTLQVNGVPTRFVVDTGATDIVLTQAAATRAGVYVDGPFTGRAMTANGMVETARVRLDTLSLGDITDRSVSAVVNSGAMSESLLGMAYLQRFERLEIENNRLLLTR